MPKLSPALMATIAARWGIVTADELRADGVPHWTVRHLVRRGALSSVHSGVYRLATSPETFEARCAAACLADAEVVITGLAAARLWAFHHTPIVDEPEALVGHDRTPLTRGVRLRRTNVLGPEDIVRRDDGIRVASPPRVWFDCAVHLGDRRFEKVTEWVIDRHAGVPVLWHTVRRLQARGRRGLARVHRVMSTRQDWQRPAGSGDELDVFTALSEHGVGPLVRQHPLRLPNGVVIHPDVAVPEIRWAVEVDHITWHGGRFDAQADKSRDRQARRIGWQVDRVSDLELKESFDAVIDDLVALFHLRTAEVAA